MEYFAIAWLLLALAIGSLISFSRCTVRTLKVNIVMIIGSWAIGLCFLFYAIIKI